MTGALSTFPSSTIARGTPTLAFVKAPKIRAPTLSKRKETIGWLV